MRPWISVKESAQRYRVAVWVDGEEVIAEWADSEEEAKRLSLHLQRLTAEVWNLPWDGPEQTTER